MSLLSQSPKRLWHTLRPLRPVQFYGRLWFRLYKPKPDTTVAPSLRLAQQAWPLPMWREPSMLAPQDFSFLNQAGSLQDLGWDNPECSKLWRYNLHYFDDLTAVRADNRIEWQQDLIADWLEQNPPGQGSGWEPYPLSLRLVNWIKWDLCHQSLDPAARESLAVQARWLCQRLEWHLLGNHLLANAKALAFAAAYFDGPEAEKWGQKACALLSRQWEEQILSDGGHFERSPMYQSILLEDMLDIFALLKVYPKTCLAELQKPLKRTIPKMLSWMQMMSHPDGQVSFFNDAAFGIAAPYQALEHAAIALGFSGGDVPATGGDLPASGYVRLTQGAATVLADLAEIGPSYLPGHAHADTLSFEMSLGSQRVIVNGGTSVYGTGADRQAQRSTTAHSTLCLSQQNSSDVWSGFRVGRRAHIQNRITDFTTHKNPTYITAQAQHTGYRHLPGRPLHDRHWKLKQDSLTITDQILGQNLVVAAEIFFHLHPSILARIVDDQTAELGLPNGQVLKVTTSDGKIGLRAGQWNPAFGQSLANTAIVVQTNSNITRCHFSWES